MKTLVVLLVGMTTVLLQSTLLRDLPPWMVPDLFLLMVLFVSLSFTFGVGIVLCFFLGLLWDLMSGAPEGWHTLFAVCIFSVNHIIEARLFVQRSRSSFGLFLLDFTLKLPYLLLLDTVFGFSLPSYDKLFAMWSGEFLTSLILMPFLFNFLTATMGVQRIRLLSMKKQRSL